MKGLYQVQCTLSNDRTSPKFGNAIDLMPQVTINLDRPIRQVFGQTTQQVKDLVQRLEFVDKDGESIGLFSP